MSTEHIEEIYHTKRALELLIASKNGAEWDIEYGFSHDTEHATEHAETEDDKIKARKNYFLLTFSVMVEVTNGDRSLFCAPFIFSLDDNFTSIQESIQGQFGIGEWSTLKVVWAGSGVDFPSIGKDRELGFNTQAILRLLRQRGGVDKLVAEVGPRPKKQG